MPCCSMQDPRLTARQALAEPAQQPAEVQRRDPPHSRPVKGEVNSVKVNCQIHVLGLFADNAALGDKDALPLLQAVPQKPGQQQLQVIAQSKVHVKVEAAVLSREEEHSQQQAAVQRITSAGRVAEQQVKAAILARLATWVSGMASA